MIATSIDYDSNQYRDEIAAFRIMHMIVVIFRILCINQPYNSVYLRDFARKRQDQYDEYNTKYKQNQWNAEYFLKSAYYSTF